MEDPSRCTGDVPSTCRLDGFCANGSVPMGVADPTSRDRAGCFRRAKAAFVAWGNAPADGPVSASFGDASGTTITRFPACAISGQCVNDPEKLADGLLPIEDQAPCLASAQSLSEQCGNGSEPITATFFGADGLATRTFPTPPKGVANGP